MLKPSKLILCIDRDNDFYQKANIAGPIIGREANLNAAIALALVDPTDVDSNALFKAISIYDQLVKENYDVELATLTGSSQLGYVADEEIANQLDKILSTKKFNSCILISDGLADQTIIPVIQSRIKIDSVQIVVMKQAQELEKTYFVLLEKLKEPYYARLIFGIPALLGLLFVLTKMFNLGLEVPVFLISFYLILKAFGIEEKLINYISSFSFSAEKISIIFYLPSILFILISLWAAYNSFLEASAVYNNLSKPIAIAIRSSINIISWAFLLMIVGKVIDLVQESKKIEIIKYSYYAIFTVLIWLLLNSGANWIINDTPPYIDFGTLLNIIIISTAIGLVSNIILSKIRKNVALKLKVSGKEVISKNGNYIGKVIGVDPNLGSLVIKSFFGEKILIKLDTIDQISENKIIVSYH